MYTTRIVPLNGRRIQDVVLELLPQLPPFPENAKKIVSNEDPVIKLFLNIGVATWAGKLEINDNLSCLLCLVPCGDKIPPDSLQLEYILPVICFPFPPAPESE